MSNLSQLLESGTRPQVVEDLTNFAEKSIAEQSGIAGVALKGAVATAKKVKSDVVAKAVNALLPDVLNEMEPHGKNLILPALTTSARSYPPVPRTSPIPFSTSPIARLTRSTTIL